MKENDSKLSSKDLNTDDIKNIQDFFKYHKEKDIYDSSKSIEQFKSIHNLINNENSLIPNEKDLKNIQEFLNSFHPKDLFDSSKSIEQFKSIEKVMKLGKDPILELSKDKIEIAVRFHKQNKYEGKIPNISKGGVDGALSKALYEKFKLKLDENELKKVHKEVNGEKRKLRKI